MSEETSSLKGSLCILDIFVHLLWKKPCFVTYDATALGSLRLLMLTEESAPSSCYVIMIFHVSSGQWQSKWVSEWVSYCVYARTHVRTYAPTCTRAHTHAHTHTHIYTHTGDLFHKSWQLFFSQNRVYMLEACDMLVNVTIRWGYPQPLVYALVAFLKRWA
jgi:hypothetical protein